MACWLFTLSTIFNFQRAFGKGSLTDIPCAQWQDYCALLVHDTPGWRAVWGLVRFRDGASCGKRGELGVENILVGRVTGEPVMRSGVESRCLSLATTLRCGRSAMPVDNARERAESLIGGFRTGERGGHIRIEHHYRASCSVAGCVFVGNGLTEIVFRKDFVRCGLG